MKILRLTMGMPATVEIRDTDGARADAAIGKVFEYFSEIDQRFSTYKPDSEISRINRGELEWADISPETKDILARSQQTKEETAGYFNIRRPDGSLDPSGLVKGWAIWQAAKLLENLGFQQFIVDIGGDIQAKSLTAGSWKIGVRNPFNREQNVKILTLGNEGIATSGTAIRGQHIYNPHEPKQPITDIASLTVVGPNVYEADRFATAAFAMGADGIRFIESVPGLEAYMIDKDGIATMTTGFGKYVQE